MRVILQGREPDARSNSFQRTALVLFSADDLKAIGVEDSTTPSDIEAALTKVIARDRQALVRAVLDNEPMEIITKALTETRDLIEKRRTVAATTDPARRINLETT